MYFELDRNLTERQKLLKETVHEFAKKVIRPASVAIDQMTNSEEIIKRDSTFWDAKRKARQAGYHIAGLPKALGGFEAGPLEFHILLEEFGWGSPGLGLSILTDSFPATAVLMYQPENKRLINDIVIPLVKDLDVKTGSAQSQLIMARCGLLLYAASRSKLAFN
jgi:alkylation response protein AidB-like acyl-CoA dehydrogenase